jgi:6,7-dimethyl-8-ribityllumazine synthase
LFDGTHGEGWYRFVGVGSALRSFDRSSSEEVMPETVPSSLDGTGLRVGIVVSTWYGDVTERLLAAALTTARNAGTADEDILVVEVPGAFELPQAASWLAREQGVDAIAALGCVVRGETPHFDYVCRTCCDGLMQVSLTMGVPVGLGVLTVENKAQADARSNESVGDGAAGVKGGNKGIEAMDAALRMAATSRALKARRNPKS